MAMSMSVPLGSDRMLYFLCQFTQDPQMHPIRSHGLVHPWVLYVGSDLILFYSEYFFISAYASCNFNNTAEHLPLKPKAKIIQSLSLLHIPDLPFPSGRGLWEPGRIAGLKHFQCVWGEGAGWTCPDEVMPCSAHPTCIPSLSLLHCRQFFTLYPWSLGPVLEWPNDLGEGYQMGFHMIMESNLYMFSYILRAKHEVTIYQRKHMW